MPITLNCPCGKTLRVPDTSAGKRARCPACQAVVTIPVPAEPEAEPVFEVVEKPTPAPSYKKPFADEDEEDDGGTYGLARPDRDDPPPGGGKSGGSGESGGGGSAAGGKKLPNFRIGVDNHK